MSSEGPTIKELEETLNEFVSSFLLLKEVEKKTTDLEKKLRGLLNEIGCGSRVKLSNGEYILTLSADSVIVQAIKQ